MQLRLCGHMRAGFRIPPVAPLWVTGGRSGFAIGTYAKEGSKLHVADGVEVSILHRGPARLGA
jgi:hypothetical protein